MHSHAIISDAAPGESNQIINYEKKFKDETSEFYKEQKNAHGE